ncbi:hypothetical protein RF11_10580 [Thelohanellus kitauei]|uniref:Uncharacterized protein n=1 Tax=Thelohanellus kitauei TaxID=669202 RepID=A0A0C2NDX6_THEKT|nr:hypothetical protein RF11_10580 [Thelohanellus kitauei]
MKNLLDQMDIKEIEIYKILTRSTAQFREKRKTEFQRTYRKDLIEELTFEFTDKSRYFINCLLYTGADLDAFILRKAMERELKEDIVIHILISRSQEVLYYIKENVADLSQLPKRKGAAEALCSLIWPLNWTDSRFGDKIANHPGSSHDQRGANLYKKKMLNCNKTPIEMENTVSTPEKRDSKPSTRGAKFPLASVTRGNEFIPSLSRDSVSSEAGASNEEAKSVSPLRAVRVYVCHASTYLQTEIDR